MNDARATIKKEKVREKDREKQQKEKANTKADTHRNTQTLYHQTDSESAAKIRSSGKMFRGSSGLAGGGIYFADSPSETSGKAHNHGVIIKCEVDRGKVKSLGSSGDSSITHRSLKKGGFDSVQIARPGGTETVVYNHGQVRIKSMSNA